MVSSPEAHSFVNPALLTELSFKNPELWSPDPSSLDDTVIVVLAAVLSRSSSWPLKVVPPPPLPPRPLPPPLQEFSRRAVVSGQVGRPRMDYSKQPTSPPIRSQLPALSRDKLCGIVEIRSPFVCRWDELTLDCIRTAAGLRLCGTSSFSTGPVGVGEAAAGLRAVSVRTPAAGWMRRATPWRWI